MSLKRVENTTPAVATPIIVVLVAMTAEVYMVAAVLSAVSHDWRNAGISFVAAEVMTAAAASPIVLARIAGYIYDRITRW